MKAKKHRNNAQAHPRLRTPSHYEPSFKKTVILYAEQKSNSEARKRYGVSETNIRRWRKLKSQIIEKAAQSVRRSQRNTSHSSPNNGGEYRDENGDLDNSNNSLDSMPLQQRLSQNSQNLSETQSIPQTQEPVLQSQPISPTKLKVTRQGAKPQVPPPKPPTPPPPNEEVCLRWNSHHTNMQVSFPNLLLKEQYVDATLVSEGQTLKCHRLILSSCSPYFEEVLNGISPFQHPVLFMKDIPFWILKALCDFMYAGEVHIFQSKLEELLAVAEALKIKGLAGSPDTKKEVKPILQEIKEEKDPIPPKKEPEKNPREEKDAKKKEEKRSKHQNYSVKEKIEEPPKLMPKLTPKVVVPKAIVPKVVVPKTVVPKPVVPKAVAPKVHTTKGNVKNVPKPSTSRNTRDSIKKSEKNKGDSYIIQKEKDKEKEKPILKKDANIIDPLDLLQPVYEEIAKEEPPAKNISPGKAKDNRNVTVKKGVNKKVKKRRYVEYEEEREESPPLMFHSRKGTRSRPNVKIPKFFHTHYDSPTKETVDATIVREPHTDQNDPLIEVEDIKAEPLDLEDNTLEVVDNMVNFVDQDQEMTSQEGEEIIGNYDSPIVNLKSAMEIKRSTPLPFSKINLVAQPLIMNVHTVTEPGQTNVQLLNINEDQVKLVDISRIGAVENRLEETLVERHIFESMDTQEKGSGIMISNVQSMAEVCEANRPKEIEDRKESEEEAALKGMDEHQRESESEESRKGTEEAFKQSESSGVDENLEHKSEIHCTSNGGYQGSDECNLATETPMRGGEELMNKDEVECEARSEDVPSSIANEQGSENVLESREGTEIAHTGFESPLLNVSVEETAEIIKIEARDESTDTSTPNVSGGVENVLESVENPVIPESEANVLRSDQGELNFRIESVVSESTGEERGREELLQGSYEIHSNSEDLGRCDANNIETGIGTGEEQISERSEDFDDNNLGYIEDRDIDESEENRIDNGENSGADVELLEASQFTQELPTSEVASEEIKRDVEANNEERETYFENREHFCENVEESVEYLEGEENRNELTEETTENIEEELEKCLATASHVLQPKIDTPQARRYRENREEDFTKDIDIDGHFPDRYRQLDNDVEMTEREVSGIETNEFLVSSNVDSTCRNEGTDAAYPTDMENGQNIEESRDLDGSLVSTIEDVDANINQCENTCRNQESDENIEQIRCTDRTHEYTSTNIHHTRENIDAADLESAALNEENLETNDLPLLTDENDAKTLEESLLEDFDDDIIMQDASTSGEPDDGPEKTLEMIVNDLNESLGELRK